MTRWAVSSWRPADGTQGRRGTREASFKRIRLSSQARRMLLEMFSTADKKHFIYTTGTGGPANLAILRIHTPYVCV